MTLDVFSIVQTVCLSVVVSGQWIMEPKVYTIYKVKKTWNEAREICHVNNNTLLSIPDSNLWQLWIDVLDPEDGLLFRADSKYWFGLHAPNASILTSHKWDDCSRVNWYQWRDTYTPKNPCIMFDVFFKPFTTVLLKLWRPEPCATSQQFICERQLELGKCVINGCDEVIQEMDLQKCNTVCNGIDNCNSRLLNVSGVDICHSYLTSSDGDFYTICQFPPEQNSLTKCENSTWDPNTSFDNKGSSPSKKCSDVIEPEITTVTDYKTTSTMTETAPAVISTTTTARATSAAAQCECRCESKVVVDNLTIEQKVKKLKKELTVNKKNTSLHKRKFISVSDSRPSATGIGSVGVAILVIVLISIFLMDIGTLKADFTTMYHNLKSGLTGKTVKRSLINNPKRTQFSRIPNTDVICTTDPRRPITAVLSPLPTVLEKHRPSSIRGSRISLISPSGAISFTNTAPISHSLKMAPQGHVEFQKKLAQSKKGYTGTKSSVSLQKSGLSSGNSNTRSANNGSSDIKEMVDLSDRSKDARQIDSDVMSSIEKDSPVDDSEHTAEDKRLLIHKKGMKKKHNAWLKMV